MITFILIEGLTLGLAFWVGYTAGKRTTLRRAQRWGRRFEAKMATEMNKAHAKMIYGDPEVDPEEHADLRNLVPFRKDDD